MANTRHGYVRISKTECGPESMARLPCLSMASVMTDRGELRNYWRRSNNDNGAIALHIVQIECAVAPEVNPAGNRRQSDGEPEHEFGDERQPGLDEPFGR